MNNVNSNTRSRYAGKSSLVALVVAASITVASTQALATVQCFTAPIAVPQTTAGVYVNLFTGTATPTPAASPGWDFNPWGSTNLFLYSQTGGGFVAVGGVIANLATGTLVDGSSTYVEDSSAAQAATYRAGVTNGKLGVRFLEGGSTYYAWVDITTTGPTLGTPATINNWCFQNTPDTGITVGTTPVSLQKFSVD